MSTNLVATQDGYVNKVVWDIGMCRYEQVGSFFCSVYS